MPLVMSKGKFERISFSTSEVALFSLLETPQSYCFPKWCWLECCLWVEWFPLNELASLRWGFYEVFINKPKIIVTSYSMQWLTSRNLTSFVCSSVQAWRNVTSQTLWANAEVSACRMRSFDNSWCSYPNYSSWPLPCRGGGACVPLWPLQLC